MLQYLPEVKDPKLCRVSGSVQTLGSIRRGFKYFPFIHAFFCVNVLASLMHVRGSDLVNAAFREYSFRLR